MKKLTLELYDKIIDTFYGKSKDYIALVGHVTRDECAEYIAFYALHGGLFWHEKNGEILAIATGHPTKKHFDWKWEPLCDTWTTHCIWSSDTKYLKNLLIDFLNTYTVRQFYACRRGKLVHLGHKKLERILKYGRRRISTSTTTSTSIQRVDEGNSASADRPCASSVCEGS